MVNKVKQRVAENGRRRLSRSVRMSGERCEFQFVEMLTEANVYSRTSATLNETFSVSCKFRDVKFQLKKTS